MTWIDHTLFNSLFFQAFIPLYEKLSEIYKEWDGDEDMISPAQASLMIVDWTDPQKAQSVSIFSSPIMH
jgi:hypothetical protein